MRSNLSRLGAILLSVIVVHAAPAAEDASGSPAGRTVARYDVFEAALTSSKTYVNPFLDVTVNATFTAPSGRTLTAYGFYDGGTTWRVRIAPDELGEWRYVTQAGDDTDNGLHNRSGTFRCVRSSNKGFIRVDPRRKYSFSYSEGTPFFALSDTCTVTSKALSDASRKSYLDARARRPFNFLRVFASLTFNAWTGKPVINTEYGYQGLQGGDINFDQQTHGVDTWRRAAWRIFTAGGAGLAAGFRGTMLSVDNAEIYYDKQQRFAPFRVAESGHARQLPHLYEFVTVRTGFRDMNPAQTLVNARNLCLANPGTEYVVYAPTGGELSLDLTGASGSFSVGWLHPRTGAYEGRAWVSAGAKQTFSSPDTNDWVLHLKKVDDRSRADWQERLERAARSPESWRGRREEIRRQILVAAGLWPEFERPPVKPVVTGQMERDGYTLKKVYLETWPGFYLTGLLYLPKKSGPLPAVLCTHGHGKNGRFGPIEEQPRAITLARLGFVVFAYDMIGYGECTQLPHEFADPLWGINLLGLQLWNSLRVVDFVSSLPEVDLKRIGVTGSSGGGTQTFLLTAVDDRIACAVPVCMVAAEFQGGCSCENAPGLRIGLNNVEIAAAAAPRPLLLISATGDWTKYTPRLEGPAIHKVYGALGVADRFRCVQFVAPHNYNQDSREAVYPWLAHWLGRAPKSEHLAETTLEAEPHENLEVFTPAHPRPPDAVDAAGLTALLKEKISRQLDALWPEDTASLERFRQIMVPALCDTFSANWPGPDQIEATTTEGAANAGSPFNTAIRHRGLPGRIELLAAAPADGKRRASLLVASTAHEVESALQHMRSDRQAVFVLRLQPHDRETASGGTEEQRRQYVHTYYRTALAWQVQDVLTALAYLTERAGFGEVELAGLGEAGIAALLARALEPTGKVSLTIADLAGVDGQDEKTWTGSRMQPGILRLGGLRTAAILAAPGPLVLHNTGVPFDWAPLRTAYRAAGRASAVEISESLWSVGTILQRLGATAAAADWHVWTVTDTRHVLRSEPPGNELEGKVAAARNEWVSFQILLRSDEPVKGVRVEAGELRGANGAALRTSESVRASDHWPLLYRQHQLQLEVGTYRNDAFKPDWYPDPLIPFEGPVTGKKLEDARFCAVPFDLPANETHGFWVDLYVPPQTAPGEYRGTYRIIADGGKSLDVPVVLTVWNFTLPRTPTLVTAFGSPAQRIRDSYQSPAKTSKEPEPLDWQAVQTQCAQLLSEHRFNAVPPSDMLRPVAQGDGSFLIPAEQVQALREFVDRYHVNALDIPHPSSVIKDPEAERDKLRAWLAAFDRAAKELNRPNIVFYIYLRDEPNTREDYEYVQKWGRAIRAAKSVVQVMVVEQTWTEPGQGGADSAWGDLYGAVDIWCPLFSLHHQDSAAKRQALGETVWAYTALCQGPPTPWWHIDYPLLNYRVPAWMAWRDRMKGLLYWGGMSYWRETDDPWLHAPVYTGRGVFQQGDKGIRFNGEGSLVYPARAVGYEGIVPTIRLKALRDAIEDYEYLALLSRLGKSAEADKIVRRLTESWFQWDKDPAACEKARAEIAAMIVAATNTPERKGDTRHSSLDEASPYLSAVRQFADQVLAHGRDTYGKPTPLFVDGSNVETLEPAKWKWADGKEWVLCNLAGQQGLFRTLDGLSRLTGESRYKDAALEALRYAFDHLRYGTQNNGGLLAWGGHLIYNATDDIIVGNPDGSGRVHELKCFFPHYELMWEADPQATRQLIENMWNGHVLNWANLDFNRHATPKKLGALWQNEYRGGEVFFDGQGLTFHNAGSDFYFAAGALSKLAGTPEPLVWAKRLAHRYVETRDPKTGLGGYQFSQCRSAWCDDVGKIRGDRAQYQYGDDFPGHRVVEGTLFPCYGNTPEVEPQVGGLLLGDQLGDAGRDFTQWVVEELTVWGKSAYRKKDNAFIPMLTDGTSMEGYVCKKDGYFGPKGRVLRAGHPGPAHLWLYAWAFRQSRDAFLWEMARNIAQGNGWGDIGVTPQVSPVLRFPNSMADPFLVMALLELHRAGGNVAFLEQAQVIGQSILKQRVQQGWFVPSQRHLFCRLGNNEAQALLHLAAALLGKPDSVPAFTGATPFFHAEYGGQASRSYDTSIIYGRTR